MPRCKSARQHREDAENVRMMKKDQWNAKLDILALQNTNLPLIPKLPYSRLVRKIVHQYKDNFHITSIAEALLREAGEFYLTFLFNDAFLLAKNRKRVTLDRSDIRMALHIRSSSQRL